MFPRVFLSAAAPPFRVSLCPPPTVKTGCSRPWLTAARSRMHSASTAPPPYRASVLQRTVMPFIIHKIQNKDNAEEVATWLSCRRVLTTLTKPRCNWRKKRRRRRRRPRWRRENLVDLLARPVQRWWWSLLPKNNSLASLACTWGNGDIEKNPTRKTRQKIIRHGNEEKADHRRDHQTFINAHCHVPATRLSVPPPSFFPQ